MEWKVRHGSLTTDLRLQTALNSMQPPTMLFLALLVQAWAHSYTHTHTHWDALLRLRSSEGSRGICLFVFYVWERKSHQTPSDTSMLCYLVCKPLNPVQWKNRELVSLRYKCQLQKNWFAGHLKNVLGILRLRSVGAPVLRLVNVCAEKAD